MKSNEPTDPDDPPDEEDLGWTFNNEIILNLQELEILRCVHVLQTYWPPF